MLLASQWGLHSFLVDRRGPAANKQPPYDLLGLRRLGTQNSENPKKALRYR